jgi:hypothetical protein
MPHADFDLNHDGSFRPSRPGPGGARAGAGRKPNGYEKPPEALDFDKAKARNEAAKAGLNEIELKIKSGQYLERAAFREATATLLAELAQGLRGLPDRLERKFDLRPEQIQLVADEIDNALAGVADGLELFVESPAA